MAKSSAVFARFGGVGSVLGRSSTLSASSEAKSLAEVFDQRQEETEERQKVLAEVAKLRKPAARSAVRKSFLMHIGAELHLPTDDARRTHTVDEPQPKAARDPFDGLPLKAWAERLGERVMPAYEAVKEEQQRMKRSAKKAVESEQIRSTFVAAPPKERKKARLSWYHPEDTMVPRDWFRGGLLADLAYYAPFSRKTEDNVGAPL